MQATNLLYRMYEHRVWVNRQIRSQVRNLSHDQLHRPLSIGQGTVWKTLTHLMAAEYVWLEAMLGNEEPLMPGDEPGLLPGNQQGEAPIGSLSELESRWAAQEDRWGEYMERLVDDDLDDEIFKVSTSSGQGQRHATRRSDILIHVCTHAQYTTAQLVNMLRQLGQSELPDAMLITLARHERTSKP